MTVVLQHPPSAICAVPLLLSKHLLGGSNKDGLCLTGAIDCFVPHGARAPIVLRGCASCWTPRHGTVTASEQLKFQWREKSCMPDGERPNGEEKWLSLDEHERPGRPVSHMKSVQSPFEKMKIAGTRKAVRKDHNSLSSSNGAAALETAEGNAMSAPYGFGRSAFTNEMQGLLHWFGSHTEMVWLLQDDCPKTRGRILLALVPTNLIKAGMHYDLVSFG